MKKLFLVGFASLSICLLSYEALASCMATVSCGGGASVNCSGSCECNVISGGVSCDGAQTCCPQK